MIEGQRRVLVLSPHPDDAEIGAGASIARMTASGVHVHIERFSRCIESLGAEVSETLIHEAAEADKVLGTTSTQHNYPVRSFERQAVLDHLIGLREKFNPDLVMVPARGDRHQDHEVVRSEALRAFRKCTLLGYELLWSNPDFAPTWFTELDADNVAAKVKAVACYRTQAERGYTSEAVTRSLLTMRGAQCGQPWAEAFDAMRVVVR